MKKKIKHDEVRRRILQERKESKRPSTSTSKVPSSTSTSKIKKIVEKPKFPPITKKPEKLEKDIFKASRKGDLSSLQWLIEKEGVNVDCCDQDNQTPLINASEYSNNHPNESLSIVEYLIEKDANVNTKNKWGNTALNKTKTVEIAKYLVEHGADIESVNNKGDTPLIWHSRKGRVDIAKYLLSVGANKEAQDSNGKTAYDVACEGYLSFDKELVKAKLQKILKL